MFIPFLPPFINYGHGGSIDTRERCKCCGQVLPSKKKRFWRHPAFGLIVTVFCALLVMEFLKWTVDIQYDSRGQTFVFYIGEQFKYLWVLIKNIF